MQPRTETEYQRAVAHFAGLAVEDRQSAMRQWSPSRRAVVRAASRHAGRLDLADIIATTPAAKRLRRVSVGMTEDAARDYEAAAGELPAHLRALALLPLATGLRSEELLSLSRQQVQRAVKAGELIFTRKGGEERRHPVVNAVALLQATLLAPAAPGRKAALQQSPLRHRGWNVIREILTPGAPITAYHLFRKLTIRLGARPHLLRSAYATRMHRDGAPLDVIRAALGHRSIETTALYLHAEAADIVKYVRQF